MAATTSIKQYTPMQICSVGGICSFENVVEYLMLGAEAVQLASVIQLNGYGVITRILEDLENWMSSHGYQDVSEFRGAALPYLRPFEDLQVRPLVSRLSEPCKEEGCDLCVACCLYDAAQRTKTGILLDADNCSGCGLCAARCPKGYIQMDWK